MSIHQLDDEVIRKFVLDTEKAVLHIFENPFPEEADTHRILQLFRVLI